MKTLRHLFEVLILLGAVSTLMVSQTTSSTVQAVIFAVDRPVISVPSIPSNSESVNVFSMSREMAALQEQLGQQSVKMTISVPLDDFNVQKTKDSEFAVGMDTHFSSFVAPQGSVSGTHLDLRSILQTEESKTILTPPRILTVTE